MDRWLEMLIGISLIGGSTIPAETQRFGEEEKESEEKQSKMHAGVSPIKAAHRLTHV